MRGNSSIGACNQPEKHVLRKAHDFDELSSSYHKLIEIVGKDCFELDVNWFKHLVSTALNKSDEVTLYGLEKSSNGTAEALLPLVKCANKSNLKSLSTFYTSLYRPLIAESAPPSALTELFFNIRHDAPNTEVINLSPMPVDDELYEASYNALKRAGWWPFRYFCFGNWCLDVQSKNYNDYYVTLPSVVRHTIERKSKKFFGQNGGSIEVLDSINGIDDAVAVYEKIYASSWKVKEPFPDFIPGLIRMFAEKGELRLGVAYVGADPVAAQIWIVRNKKAAIYKLAYDEKYSNLSVGTILTSHLMRHVIEVDQVKVVDYLIGDDPYKKDWMSRRQERWGIVAYNARTIRGIFGICKEVVGRTFKLIMPPWIS